MGESYKVSLFRDATVLSDSPRLLSNFKTSNTLALHGPCSQLFRFSDTPLASFRRAQGCNRETPHAFLVSSLFHLILAHKL
jgi:hypothetical protein